MPRERAFAAQGKRQRRRQIWVDIGSRSSSSWAWTRGVCRCVCVYVYVYVSRQQKRGLCHRSYPIIDERCNMRFVHTYIPWTVNKTAAARERRKTRMVTTIGGWWCLLVPVYVCIDIVVSKKLCVYMHCVRSMLLLKDFPCLTCLASNSTRQDDPQHAFFVINPKSWTEKASNNTAMAMLAYAHDVRVPPAAAPSSSCYGITSTKILIPTSHSPTPSTYSPHSTHNHHRKSCHPPP